MLKIQTYLIKELAEIENVAKPTIHDWIEKGLFIPVSFRRGITARRESVRYLSRTMSAMIKKTKGIDEISESELQEVIDIEAKRVKLESAKVRKPRKGFTS